MIKIPKGPELEELGLVNLFILFHQEQTVFWWLPNTFRLDGIQNPYVLLWSSDLAPPLSPASSGTLTF